MKAKHVWWSLASVVTVAAVGGTAALGLTIQDAYDDLEHGPAFSQPAAPNPLRPAEAGDVDTSALTARLDEAAQNPGLATFGGQVIDTTTGEVLWEKDADRPLLPASSTKVLTAAAATYELDEDEKIATEVVRGSEEGSVIIKAAGDVWLTQDALDALADDIGSATAVYIDTTAWSGDAQAEGWDPDNVDAGFVAPMQPAMLYGARLGDTTGDVPRSHTPAEDVARQLAEKVGASESGFGEAPAEAEVVASVESPPLSERAQDMMKHSDNVMAEAIGRELAIARGMEPSFTGATQATLDVLSEHGVNVDEVTLADNSGLSDANRIPAGVLAQLVERGAEEEALRPLLTYLPVAGGEGTLYERYGDLAGKGYVRAKTGTLTGTSALVGTVQGQSERVYALSLLVNDGDILAARQAQDEFASVLREF
ncbi:D-alanyl-D-alanine carboxypeptidase/D-alanyl-D-alanine-endopeptidase [Corynebacterium camporealensis]|uniref:D-alanyl-D-alanine carboxypeptidase/D-alanyl-D-alanine endopeptidase n=1 Tax=Corynebacterium camporealensis TaxID=161896 RepID=UPI0034CE44A8